MHWVLIAVCRLSLVVVRGGYSSCGAWASHCGGFSLLWSMSSRHAGFSSCVTQASVVVACGLSSCGLRAVERRLSSCGTWA